ncbi:MAG TPA: GNAT family protein [Candidatus Limnocylindria bacterium]|nr:GNAT family protein [Candidatus Limnocylindria bacterium]
MTDVPRVRLRDVTLSDADLLDEWANDPRDRGGFNDFGGAPRATPREVLEKGPLRNERNGILIVERVEDGAPLGTVSWHRVNYGPSPQSDAWNCGIELIPEARGMGYGAEAQRLLARWLFDNSDLNRVEASTDVENVAEQRSLEKAGFTREGIQRGAQFRAGAYHDLVTYAVIRSDLG